MRVVIRRRPDLSGYSLLPKDNYGRPLVKKEEGHRAQIAKEVRSNMAELPNDPSIFHDDGFVDHFTHLARLFERQWVSLSSFLFSFSLF